jgi:hypothetical protein
MSSRPSSARSRSAQQQQCRGRSSAFPSPHTNEPSRREGLKAWEAPTAAAPEFHRDLTPKLCHSPRVRSSEARTHANLEDARPSGERQTKKDRPPDATLSERLESGCLRMTTFAGSTQCCDWLVDSVAGSGLGGDRAIGTGEAKCLTSCEAVARVKIIRVWELVPRPSWVT